MSKYHIATRTDGTGFDVHVVTNNGARQTVLGFATEHLAQAWIAQDQRLTRAADPFRLQRQRVGKSWGQI